MNTIAKFNPKLPSLILYLLLLSFLLLAFLLSYSVLFESCNPTHEPEDCKPPIFTKPKMYWTAPETKTIFSANLDGTEINSIVNTTTNPIGIDVYRNKVYWTAYGEGKAMIQRANLDGCQIENLVQEDLVRPTGISVSGNKMYWLDPGDFSIKRANLDGSGVEILIRALDMGAVSDIEVYKNKMYWTNPKQNKIQRADLNGDNLEDVKLNVLNPIGLSLHDDKIYWAENSELLRSNLDGSAVEGITADQVGLPVDLAFSGTEMYWTNSTNKILRANLNGSNKTNAVANTETNGFITIDNSQLEIEYVYEYKDSSLNLCHPILKQLAGGNRYQWFDGTGKPVTGISTSNCFTVDQLDFVHEGYYYCQLLDGNNTVVKTSPLYFLQLNIVDSLGGAYPPDQVIVKWKAEELLDQDALDLKRNELLDLFNGEFIEECVCGGIELWRLFPGELIIDGMSLSTIEDKVNKLEERSEAEEVELNFLFENNSQKDTTKVNKANQAGTTNSPLAFGSSTGMHYSDTVRVAVIDTGIDMEHNRFKTTGVKFSKNPKENGADEDGNCVIGDIKGYNFSGDNSNPHDDNGHGTHVADIIRQVYSDPDVDHHADKVLLEIITIKSHGADGGAYLFDEVCAFLYAQERGASIINFSAGRYGSASNILRKTIEEMEDILIIASAGNDTSDNSITPHYPSSYDLDNIIEVAAGEYNIFPPNPNDPNSDQFYNYRVEPGIANFSNYGTDVDIIARGNQILAAMTDEDQNNTLATKSGTSQAAAVISGVAARVKSLCLNLSAKNIREYILVQGESEFNFIIKNNGKIKQGRVHKYTEDYFEDLVNSTDLCN